jgi:hypothetical protein
MFTIAGRPAANVSKSLFGEFVASTGTSLKSVRQAADSPASLATSAFVPSRKATFGGAARSSSSRRLPSPMSTNDTSGRSRAAPTAAVRSFASPIAPKYDTRNVSRGVEGSNRSRSAAFGTRADFSAGRHSRIPGDSAITRALRAYTKRSTARARCCASGLRSTPIWIGASGQRSRTSNTSGARQRAAAASAGSAIVSGGEVA